MPTVRSVTWVELHHAGSLTYSQQGSPVLRRDEPLARTVDGEIHERTGRIAPDQVVQLWSSDEDDIQSFDKLFFRCSQPCWLQLISSSGSQTIRVAAQDPYVRSSSSVSTAYGPAAIVSAPVIEPLTEVLALNDQPTESSYHFLLVD